MFSLLICAIEFLTVEIHQLKVKELVPAQVFIRSCDTHSCVGQVWVGFLSQKSKIQNPKGENVSLHRLGNFTVRNEDIGNILDKDFHLSVSGRLPKKQFYLGHLGGVGWSQTCINQFCQIHGKSPNSIKLIGFRILNVWGVWVCPQFCVICSK